MSHTDGDATRARLVLSAASHLVERPIIGCYRSYFVTILQSFRPSVRPSIHFYQAVTPIKQHIKTLKERQKRQTQKHNKTVENLELIQNEHG